MIVICVFFVASAQVLVFVDSQHTCDSLFLKLLEVGYHAIVLHGGMDQTDREAAIEDFKNGVSQVRARVCVCEKTLNTIGIVMSFIVFNTVCERYRNVITVIQVLIATSIAARGLDVKQLRLVVNYACPNHYEDYVHRCGRTGRANTPGTAVTFIGEGALMGFVWFIFDLVCAESYVVSTIPHFCPRNCCVKLFMFMFVPSFSIFFLFGTWCPEEERFAPELIKALTHSSQPIPADLAALAAAFAQKRAEGKVKYGASSGFGGRSFGFAGEERAAVADAKRAQRTELGFEEVRACCLSLCRQTRATNS